MNISPVVLFVYNRLWHTRQTVEALQKNELASDSELFIFSDGPKTEAANESVREVRNYVRSISGFKNISIIEREKNWGLADSIIDGVTRIVNEYGRVIVLEDDLVTSPFFLRYMNDALEFYKDENRVMHVSGYMFPIFSGEPNEVVFIKPTTCWGWATWDRAWKYFDKDIDKIFTSFKPQMIKDFNLDGAYDYFSHLNLNKKGKINTWAIFWYASVYLQNGLSLHPKQSFVQGIGHDDTGIHSGKSDMYKTCINQAWPFNFSEKIIEDTVFKKKLSRFYNSNKSSLYKRILPALKRKIKRGIDAIK